jgi:3',5'-cyclic-AMP phosphodiesterase
MEMTRRGMLAWLAVPALAETANFRFVHVTDLHIQPELRAAEGVRQCFAAINAARPDFVIAGGDLVFDALAVGHARARMLFDLYRETAERLDAPLHNTLGNHDVFGLYAKSGVAETHAQYGKRMYEELIGPRYYSFDFAGWHFVVLDSIGFTTQRTYIGYVDEAQFAWLESDLAKVGKTRPVVAVTHVPLSTGFLQWMTPRHDATMIVVQNAAPVLELLHQYNVKAVLQGHTHICERLEYRGCQYITSGSVCGQSWRGPKLGVHKEGFGIVTVKNGELSYRYQPYGFQAVSDTLNQ